MNRPKFIIVQTSSGQRTVYDSRDVMEFIREVEELERENATLREELQQWKLERLGP
jgi:hypothetical protein